LVFFGGTLEVSDDFSRDKELTLRGFAHSCNHSSSSDLA